MSRLFVCAALVLAAGTPRAGAQTGPFVELAGEFSPVTIGGRDVTWRLGRVAAGVVEEERFGWTASAERHQRAALVDWTASAAGFRRAGDWTLSGGGGGVTGAPDFLYRYSVEGELARRVAGSLVVHGGYRHLSFPDFSVQIVQPAVSWYFPRGEVQARLFGVRHAARDRRSAAVLLRAAWGVHPRVRVGGGAAVGERIFDVAALSEGEAGGWVAFGHAAVRVAPRWHVDVGAGRAREADVFSGRTFSLGVRRTFR